MKTRKELLAMAEEALLSWDHREGEYGTSKAMFAQACVMLAKELREGEQSPTYAQANELIEAVRNK